MSIRYDALLESIKEVEHDNHIIVDRRVDKVQEVSLKRFILFSNVLVAANIKLEKIYGKEHVLTKADPKYSEKKVDAKSRLEGEKKLSQLRKLNSIYSNWERSLIGRKLPKSVKELEKEQKKLEAVIQKMRHFKEGLEEKIDKAELFEAVTPIDRAELQKLNDSLNALETGKEVLSSHIAIKKGTFSPEQASRILRIEKEFDPILKETASNRLQGKLNEDVIPLKKLKSEINALIEKKNPQQVDEIAVKIKEYEDLHNSIEKRFAQIKNRISKNSQLFDLLKDRALFNINLLMDMRAKIEVYNNDALKLSPLKKSHNLEALELHKSLSFFKKLEKKLLAEEINVREKKRSNAHEAIERNEPKISIPFPNLDNVEGAQKEALQNEHKRKVETYDKKRDEIVIPAKDLANEVIDIEFDYTKVESKIIDLGDFPYVKAYDFYQKGKPVEAGKEIWKSLIRTNEGKLPSKDDFDHEAREIFGERLDPQIYNGLINDFHKSKKADAQGDLVWFMWVNDKKSIPTFDEFKAAFEEKVGIEPLKENYDRLIHHLNTQGKPRVAENVWVHLSGKNKESPRWNDFIALFKESLGVEPEKELYTALVRKELDEKEDKLKEVLGDLKGLAPFAKPKETWYAKDDKTIRIKLKDIESEIEKINARLIENADKSRGSAEEETKQLKKQLEQTILERESVINFLNNKDRIQLRNEAQQLNSQIILLKSRLKEAQ